MNISDFLTQIDSTPSDYPFILSVFADWLEEKGDSRFISIRWLSQKKIEVISSYEEQKNEDNEYLLWNDDKKTYRWWSFISQLRSELFTNLSSIVKTKYYSDCAEYDSISSAFLDLANSYTKTIQENPDFR